MTLEEMVEGVRNARTSDSANRIINDFCEKNTTWCVKNWVEWKALEDKLNVIVAMKGMSRGSSHF